MCLKVMLKRLGRIIQLEMPGMSRRRLKHALELACEPASPFPRPYFTDACVSRKSGFARVGVRLKLEEVLLRRKTASLALSLLTLRTIKVRSHYNDHAFL